MIHDGITKVGCHFRPATADRGECSTGRTDNHSQIGGVQVAVVVVHDALDDKLWTYTCLRHIKKFGHKIQNEKGGEEREREKARAREREGKRARKRERESE